MLDAMKAALADLEQYAGEQTIESRRKLREAISAHPMNGLRDREPIGVIYDRLGRKQYTTIPRHFDERA